MGFEPMTFRLLGGCSDHLSYGSSEIEGCIGIYSSIIHILDGEGSSSIFNNPHFG